MNYGLNKVELFSVNNTKINSSPPRQLIILQQSPAGFGGKQTVNLCRSLTSSHQSAQRERNVSANHLIDDTMIIEIQFATSVLF